MYEVRNTEYVQSKSLLGLVRSTRMQYASSAVGALNVRQQTPVTYITRVRVHTAYTNRQAPPAVMGH
jgi:hypothetical protein